MSSFPPFPAADREAALAALEDFLPRAGRDYAEQRNHDQGPSHRTNVSLLSPWIRVRQLPEWEVVAAVRREHGATAVGKFIDEVCWRTYWKGWLQLRPTVWRDYRQRVARLQAEAGRDGEVQAAVAGKTGIDCFDAWARELVETGYLHNHARMWVASIWIHTLMLPWELGADWFLRHLLDGDPASNTLSWRWVAGLHTAGKTYLATRPNVRRYTQDRFEVTADFAKTPVDLEHSPPPPVQPLQELPAVSAGGRTGILLTDEDVSAAAWLTAEDAPAAVAGFFLAEAYEEWGTADHVVRFRKEAMWSALGKSADNGLFESVDRLADWLKATQIEVLLMAEPPVGIWTDILPRVTRVCRESGVQLSLRRHGWDTLLWPHATHGFFRFKKVIPQVLTRLDEWEG